MILDDIADYLSSGGLGVVGTTIFKGFMPGPPVVDAVLVIYETGGQEPQRAMSAFAGETVVVERPRIQVVCRDTANDYEAASVVAARAYAMLDGMPTREINGVSYKWGAAVQPPFPMGRDKAGRVLVACNYDIVKEMEP